MALPPTTINKQFVETHLLTKSGGLNPRALEVYGISKESAYQVYHGLSGPSRCKECSKPTTFLSFKKGYTTFCSNKCVGKNKEIQDKKLSTVVNNFGPDGHKSLEILNKKKQTSLANYGVEWPRQNADFVNDLKEEFLKKYGVTNPSTTLSATEKRTKTNLARYGGNPQTTNAVKEKTRKTNIEKYGVSCALSLCHVRQKALKSRRESESYDKLNDPEWLENNKFVPSTVLSEQLGVAWSTVLSYYKKHSIERPHVIVSAPEIIIVDFLIENNVKYIQSERTILEGKEIDIYLPEYNIGIEVDGLYWHSETFISNKYYHMDKTKFAADKGIQLIHITDYEIEHQFNIVKTRLLSKLGRLKKVYARQCNVVHVDNRTYNEYMNSNHIQGTSVASVRLGLERAGELVAVMSFSKPRYNKKYEWELIRYASSDTVLGGASKLFKHFIKTFSPVSIISYSDLRWNTGNVNTKIGMTLSHVTRPNYWYIDNGMFVHRTKFQKHKLKNLLSSFDNNLSERENMKNNGYARFWDCGNAVFIWQK